MRCTVLELLAIGRYVDNEPFNEESRSPPFEKISIFLRTIANYRQLRRGRLTLW
ncbi:MAG: hypothetical protein AAF889_02105 [Cyanobacteria bacterium P01_D01_bin.73]